MEFIIGLLFLLDFYVLIGGMISPKNTLFFISKEKRNRKIAALSFFVIAVVSFVLAVHTPVKEETEKSDDISEKCYISMQENSDVNDDKQIESDHLPYISEISPSDISKHLKSSGFSEKTNFDKDFGYLWEFSKKIEGVSHNVTLFSDNKNNINSIRLNFIADNVDIPVGSSYKFSKELAKIVFKNNKSDDVIQWIWDNYNNDKAAVMVNNIEINIQAPSILVRSINIKAVR